MALVIRSHTRAAVVVGVAVGVVAGLAIADALVRAGVAEAPTLDFAGRPRPNLVRQLAEAGYAVTKIEGSSTLADGAIEREPARVRQSVG